MKNSSLPFSVDRRRRGNLARQIADVLRGAISTGYWKPGDVLPPIRELAQLFDVGRVNVERAIAILTGEGLLNPRPKIGSVVCSPDFPVWKGMVLIVVPSGGANHLINTVSGALRDALASAGYLFLEASVACKADGTFDFSMLATMLRQKVDLVVQLHDKKEISCWLSGQGVPFLRLTGEMGSFANCVGEIFHESDRALSDFAAHCRERHICRVLQMYVWREMLKLRECLDGDVCVDEWLLDMPVGQINGPAVAQAAADAVRERLEREGRSWLPEVLCLCDDYRAGGVIAALLAAGIRIPEDVRMVVWTNRGSGCGPAFVKPLTRLELDCIGYGAKVAECTLHYLQTGAFQTNATVGPEYVRGDTF